MLWPALEAGTDVKVAQAFLRDLRADADLAAIFGSKIKAIEEEELFQRGSWLAPTLAVRIASLDEKTIGNAMTGQLLTLLEIYMLTQVDASYLADEDFPRARLVNRIKSIAWQNWGVLVDDEDPPNSITIGIPQFQRLDFVGFDKTSGRILTKLRIVFNSEIDQFSREGI